MKKILKLSKTIRQDKLLVAGLYRLLWACLATSLLTALIQFFGPLMARKYLNDVSPQNIVIACALILGSFVLVACLQLVFLLFKNRRCVHIKSKMLSCLINRILALKYDALIAKEPTYLLDRALSVVEALFDFYSETLPGLFTNITTILACYAAALIIHWPMTIVFSLIILIQFFGYRGLNEKLGKMSVRLSKTAAQRYTILNSLLGNVDFLKQLSDRTAIQDFTYEKERDEKKIEADINIFAGKVSIVFDNLLSIFSNGIYVYIPIALMMKWMSLGDSVYLSLVSSLFMPAAKKMVGARLNMKALYAADEFLNKEIAPNLENETDGLTLVEPVTSMTFDINDLSIGDKNILNRGTAQISSGDIVKISGETGSGKSSLAKSIVGFRAVKQATINGTSIQDYSVESIRNHILYIPQQAPVFSGTIAENIMLGLNDSVSDEWLGDRLKDTIFQKYVVEAYGLTSMVLENGSNLSGGDKQKISLARTEIFPWDVLILDEATSALDTKTQKELLSYICEKARARGAIVFIISHSMEVNDFCTKEIRVENQAISCKELDQ